MTDLETFLPYFNQAFPDGMTFKQCAKVVSLFMENTTNDGAIASLLQSLGVSGGRVSNETFLKKVFCRNMFVSCQQTELLHDKYAELADDNMVAIASTCKFNITQKSVPQGVQGRDVPCYGSIPNALAEMMLDDVFQKYFKRLQAERPSYTLDSFVQKKMGKVTQMCNLATTELKVRGPDKDAFDKVRLFADAFAKLDPKTVTTEAQWKQWVSQYVPDDYQDNLSFDRMLSNFGVDDDTARAVREHEITEEKDGKKDTNTLEQHSLRWLGKALTGFKPKGCLTDLVNLLFAMERKEPKKDMPEREIVQTIKDVHQKIKKLTEQPQDLWIPDILMHDAENDDMLCWVLLDFIRDTLKLKPLEVHIQLPYSDKFDGLVDGWKKLGEHVTAFKDVNSLNEAALLHNFGLD